MSDKATTVSLVLGSGGARGLAHIGAIKALTERDYEIRCIAGSSMGALIGGVYAMGKLDVYEEWACALEKFDVMRLLDFTWGGNGLFKGERLFGVMRDMLGDSDIEDLDIAYTAVATDLGTQREIWLQTGPLFDAIRASIAIPSVFTPHRHQGRVLVDGGLVNPIPIAPTLSQMNDLVIAVDVNAPIEGGRKARSGGRAASMRGHAEQVADDAGLVERVQAFVSGLMTRKSGQDSDDGWNLQQLMGSSLDTMQNTITRIKLAMYDPDLVIRVPISVCAFYEFYRARELIDLGYERATRALDQLDSSRSPSSTRNDRNQHQDQRTAEDEARS